MPRFIGRMKHNDRRQEWTGQEGDGSPQMHIFGKSAYDWSVTDDGEQLHVVSRGAGEQAEEALGIASTHSPSGGPMAGRSGGEREDDRKPWDTKGRARDADLPRPPAVQGGGAQPPVPGALGRFYDAYYARHP